MQALKEITKWADGSTSNHTYLLDGDQLIAYVKLGTDQAHYFKSPIKGFSRTGRKFQSVDLALFDQAPEPVIEPWIKQVAGSKPGVFYRVNTQEGTCSCPGYTFRGACKHTN